MEAAILVQSLSPGGNLEAVVEQDDRCAFLYLRALWDPSDGPEYGVKSCWVRNLRAAPPTLSVEDMRAGRAPMLPAPACAHPGGAAPLSKDALRIVWLEEGDGAALLEGDALLAVVPCWSGHKGFRGYARDCAAQSPLAWPLRPDDALHARVRAADAWWRAWETGDPWPPVQEAGTAALKAAFGEPASTYAIDGGHWPPRVLLRFLHEDAVVLATCGLQLRPQPTVELYAEDPRPLRRIELGLAMERGLFEAGARRLLGWLAGQTDLPWSRLTWFGHHHTMPCDANPVGPSRQRFEAMLFARDPWGAPAVALPPFRGDPVTLLWLVPISGPERDLAAQGGSAELARRLLAAGHGWIHRDRAPVA